MIKLAMLNHVERLYFSACDKTEVNDPFEEKLLGIVNTALVSCIFHEYFFSSG